MEDDRRTKIMNMFYDWTQEREIMYKIQKCQRNWDYSKWDSSVDTFQEMINELLWTAEQSPSKQHEGNYDLYYTADREVIQELSRYTWGNTNRRDPPSNWRNAQSNASLYIIWVAKYPETERNCNADGTIKKNGHHERWLNGYVSIGISIGLTMRAAAKMGLATGCNKNHNDINGNDFWGKRLGIMDEIKNGTKKITYGLGVGFPQEGRPRWEQDETEIMIGASNGSKITLGDQTHHPRTGHPMRKAKIIDIRTTDKAVDPYGVTHIIPDMSKAAVNSFQPKGIKIIEIK